MLYNYDTPYDNYNNLLNLCIWRVIEIKNISGDTQMIVKLDSKNKIVVFSAIGLSGKLTKAKFDTRRYSGLAKEGFNLIELNINAYCLIFQNFNFLLKLSNIMLNPFKLFDLTIHKVVMLINSNSITLYVDCVKIGTRKMRPKESQIDISGHTLIGPDEDSESVSFKKIKIYCDPIEALLETVLRSFFLKIGKKFLFDS